MSCSGPNNGTDLLPLLRAPGPGIAWTDGSHFATIAASPGLAAGPGSTARGRIRMTACIVGWSHTPFGKHENDDVESLIGRVALQALEDAGIDRKSTRLNSSH